MFIYIMLICRTFGIQIPIFFTYTTLFRSGLHLEVARHDPVDARTLARHRPVVGEGADVIAVDLGRALPGVVVSGVAQGDRKRTRLNSSHVAISFVVLFMVTEYSSELTSY